MKYQKKTRSTSSQKIAKINEKEFWDLFHQVHNKHLTSSIGKVKVNVKKKN
jgi:hypothetical protein